MKKFDKCVICGKKVVLRYHCHNNDCTCYGLPLGPTTCSDDCSDDFMIKHGLKR